MLSFPPWPHMSISPWAESLMDIQLFWASSSAKLPHGLQPKAAETCPSWLCFTAASSSAYMEPTMGDWALPAIWGTEEKHLLTRMPFPQTAGPCRRGGWGWQGQEWDWEQKHEVVWKWGPTEVMGGGSVRRGHFTLEVVYLHGKVLPQEHCITWRAKSAA